MSQKVACHISREGKFWYTYVKTWGGREGKCVGSHLCSAPWVLRRIVGRELLLAQDNTSQKSAISQAPERDGS